MIFPTYLLIYCNDNNIFLGGGVEEAGHLGGGGFYPSNTLDRTLAGRVYNFLHVRPKQGLI